MNLSSESPHIERLLRFINDDVPFAQFCGVEVLKLDESGGTARLPDRRELRNHVGTQHAGALFTVAEAASGACMLGLVGARFEQILPLASDARITYRRPARGPIDANATTDAEAKLLHRALDEAGRCDFTVHVTLSDADAREVAEADVRWHLRVRP